MSGKMYCTATVKFTSFLAEINGKHARLAKEAGVAARTIARIKMGERINTGTARDVFKAACKEQFGYIGDFQSAFVAE